MLDQEFRGAARTTTVVDDPLTNRAAGGHEVHFWFFLGQKVPRCMLQTRGMLFAAA